MTIENLIAFTVLFTVVTEGLTLWFRFGMGLRSPEVTASTVGRLTRGWRVHHGYWVLPLVPLGVAIWGMPGAAAGWSGGLIVAFGLAMLLSDLLHHFVFLKRLTGCSEWDWKYPVVQPVAVPVPVASESMRPVNGFEANESIDGLVG